MAKMSHFSEGRQGRLDPRKRHRPIRPVKTHGRPPQARREAFKTLDGPQIPTELRPARIQRSAAKPVLRAEREPKPATVRRIRRTTETKLRRERERAASIGGRPSFADFLERLRPEDIWGYPHFVRVWIKRPLSKEEHKFLRSQCHGSFSVHNDGGFLRDAEGNKVLRTRDSRRKNADGKPVYKRGDPVRLHINLPYMRELHLICPKPAALKFLADRDDRVAFTNSGALPERDKKLPKTIYLEIAFDLIMRDGEELRQAFDAFTHSFVQPWMGWRKKRVSAAGDPNQKFEREKRTKFILPYANFVSTGRRWPGTSWALYTGKHSPVTGQIDAFKLEQRHHGAHAVRSVAKNLHDLANIDYAAHMLKAVTLQTIDLERLGRYHNNKANGTKRQKPHPDDIRTGRVLWRAYGYDLSSNGTMSVQSFLDQYGRGPFVKSIPFDHLLPDAESALCF